MKRIVVLMVILSMLVLPVHAAPSELPVKSALLMDATTGKILYDQNIHQRLAPASVTKVMTLLLIMEAIDSGTIHWDDMVTASETAAAKGGSQIYLKAGEQMSVTDMVKSIAVSSANDAACAMAEHLQGSEEAFVQLMNRRAGDLGMSDTHFVNCTGLDDSADAAQHLTSAHDIALMSRELLEKHPKITEFTTIWMDTIRNGTFGLSNTNKLVRFYPGATGLKTGFTANAGYCLSASAQRDGMQLIAVVMGGKTSAERFSACKQLLDWGFANFALVTPEVGSGTVPVKLGVTEKIEVVPMESPQLLVDKSQRSSVSTEITLEESVTAPVSRGQRLGTMTIRVGQQVLRQIPMIAKEPVEKLTWWKMFTKLLRRITMAPM